MEGLVFLIIILLLFFLVGSALGIAANSRSAQLERDLAAVRKEVKVLREKVTAQTGVEHPLAESSGLDASTVTGNREITLDSDRLAPVVPEHTAGIKQPSSPEKEEIASRAVKLRQPAPLQVFFSRLKENWMAWIGGLCVALAGIFLAQYTIEKGIIGPGARIALGLLTGVALHLAAEYLRRSRNNHPAFAALAGGGSITLFAILLAALHYYNMISPTQTFALLAVVALVTMALSWWHGPLMAALGLLGAYIVPMLVSSGSGNVVVVLVYSLIISSAALLLMRYVYRPWLLWGMMTGAMGWWLLTLDSSQIDGLRGLYLAALAWLIMAVPRFDWAMKQTLRFSAETYSLNNIKKITEHRERWLPLILLIICAAQCLSILAQGDFNLLILQWSALPIVLLIAAHNRDSLWPLPWLLFVGQCVVWIYLVISTVTSRIELAPVSDTNFLWYCLTTALIFTVFSLRNFANGSFRPVWASLATLAPVLMLATAWLVTGGVLPDWLWAAVAGIAACACLGLASERRHQDSPETLVVWLLVAGHFALTLAAVFLLPPAGITLGIAIQMVSLAWIIKRYKLNSLGWLLKVIVALVITRLTLNPWLFSYTSQWHWTLWTYGGSTLCAWLASRLLSDNPRLKVWAEGAFMHLLVLTCWTEMRYWLHDGEVFTAQWTFLESALYTLFFGVMSVVYFQRSLRSQIVRRLYKLFANALLVLAALNYLVIMLATLNSEYWQWSAISSTPVFNLMLLAYGAPVLISLLVFLFHDQRYRAGALITAAVTAFIFISFEIRHLWQGELRINTGTSEPELYTYSIVWLLMAITSILAGAWRYGKGCTRAGLALLTLVIAKIFLVDMSDLEGLLKVASFMGLGLGLLAVSYLYQRLNDRQPPAEVMLDEEHTRNEIRQSEN